MFGLNAYMPPVNSEKHFFCLVVCRRLSLFFSLCFVFVGTTAEKKQQETTEQASNQNRKQQYYTFKKCCMLKTFTKNANKKGKTNKQ